MSEPEAPVTGLLVLVVGPSGAGKDTLIAGARATLAGDARFCFVRRVVTRPEGCHERHDTLDEAAFAMAQAQGAFVFSWRAHGLDYGVPASIAGELRAGRTVIVNTSRKVIAEARGKFAHVLVLQVTAPARLLAERIASRGTRGVVRVTKRSGAGRRRSLRHRDRQRRYPRNSDRPDGRPARGERPLSDQSIASRDPQMTPPAVKPPSTAMTCPVTKLDRVSSSRWQIVPAISSGVE